MNDHEIIMQLQALQKVTEMLAAEITGLESNVNFSFFNHDRNFDALRFDLAREAANHGWIIGQSIDRPETCWVEDTEAAHRICFFIDQKQMEAIRAGEK